MALSRPQGMSVSLIGALALATASARAANNPSYPVSVLNPPGYSDIYATSMTIGPDGNIWVAEGFKNRVGRLAVTINSTTTVASSTYTAFAANPSTSTAGITSGPDGNLWFTELNTNKIARMTTQGVITEFAVPNQQADLGAITSGPDGAVWFIDTSFFSQTNLGRIAADGTVQEFPVAPKNAYIQDLTAGADGNLWFVDGNAFQLYKVSTAGSVLATYTIPNHGSQQINSRHIILGPDGNVWFPGVNTLDRAKPDGTITEYAVPTANAFPAGLTIGADGNIWFSEHNSGEIGYLMLSSANDSGQATIVESNLAPFQIFQADQLFLIPPPSQLGTTALDTGAPHAMAGSSCQVAFLVSDIGSEPGQNLSAVEVGNPSTCADVFSTVFVHAGKGAPPGLSRIEVWISNNGPNHAEDVATTIVVSPSPSSVQGVMAEEHFNESGFGGTSWNRSTLKTSSSTGPGDAYQLQVEPYTLFPSSAGIYHYYDAWIYARFDVQESGPFVVTVYAASPTTPDQNPFNNTARALFNNGVFESLPPPPPILQFPSRRGGH